MIEILDFHIEDVIGIRIDGKITSEEFDEIAGILEEKLAKHKKISIYVELDSFGGMSPETFLKDLKFGLKHWRELQKEAIVTNQDWIQKITPVLDELFPQIKVKVFPPEEKKWAKKWVSEE